MEFLRPITEAANVVIVGWLEVYFEAVELQKLGHAGDFEAVAVKRLPRRRRSSAGPATAPT